MMSVPSSRSTAWPIAGLSLVLLAGCQSIGPGSGPAADGWHVVERTGDARWSALAQERWTTLASGDVVPVPATVVTGPASRVILVHDERRVRLGPDSRVVLPAAAEPHLFEQASGTAEYRLPDTGQRPVRVETPHARAESRGGVFQIEIGSDFDTTGFTVSEGALRVAHADGLRGITIRSEQQALARVADGPKLAFSRASGAPFEPVAPVIAAIAGDDPVAPATVQSQAESVQQAPPERHPSARQRLVAKPRASSIADRPGPETDRAEVGKAPGERIILPATFSSPQAEEEEAAGGDEAAVDEAAVNEEAVSEDAGAPWSLTKGLLEGLPQTPEK